MIDAADENFVVHVSWAARGLPDARVRIAPDLVLVDSGLACDTFNFACRVKLSREGAAARVAELVGFFRETGHPYSCWVTPGSTPAALRTILEDAGLAPAESELAMVASLSDLSPPPPPPTGIEISRVATPDDLEAYARILAENWSPPDPDVLRFHRLAAPRLLAPASPQRLYLARLEGDPVATAEVTVAGGVAGVYNISTRTAHRRVGIGTAITYAPLRDAAREGIATAVLQAAPDGVGVYRRLGFSSYGEVTEFKPAPEAP
ncbi:MAG TPA: GNAT family N-acetyltransferase [Candidatus Polarisedimenticolaceae bacterium]